MTTTTTTIWATGRQQCITALRITKTPQGIIAIAEADQIADRQMQTALAGEFPGRTFQLVREDGYLCASSALEVMSNDGLATVS